MVLELIQSQKFIQISGVNMVKLLVSSKWENASMETQTTLVHINNISLVFSTIQCTTLSRMSSDQDKVCTTSKIDLLKKTVNSKMLMLLVFSLITMTTLDSKTNSTMTMVSNLLLLSLWLEEVFHSTIMVLNKTTLVVMIQTTENLSGKIWTPTLIFIRWLRRLTLPERLTKSGTTAKMRNGLPTISMLTTEVTSSLLWPTLETTNNSNHLLKDLPAKEPLYATSSIQPLTAKKFKTENLISILREENQRSTCHKTPPTSLNKVTFSSKTEIIQSTECSRNLLPK